MSDRLTLATSTGLPFLSLAFHVATGLVALAAGFMAIAVRKGGTWHRRSGLVFVYTMIATVITAAGVLLIRGQANEHWRSAHRLPRVHGLHRRQAAAWSKLAS